MLAAKLGDRMPVLGRRDDDATHGQHWLADERGDPPGAEARGRLLELAGAVVERAAPVWIGRRQVVEAAGKLADAHLEPREATRRKGAVRHAVVGVGEREDERSIDLAPVVVVEPRHLDRALAALRAAVREEDL